MGMDKGLFDVLERRGSGGFFPLNENHWSNALAWLLTPHEDNSVGRTLLGCLIPSFPADEGWAVDRESAFEIDDRIRFIDVVLSFSGGKRCFIEVKIDPAYQDRNQISDQLRILGDGDYYVLLAPLDLTVLVNELRVVNPGVEVHATTWKALGDQCSKSGALAGSNEIQRTLLDGIADYWNRAVVTPFEAMARTIIEENGWTAFYPDDFKDAFLARFPEVWSAWVCDKPASGNGNPHQYLLTCLAMLAKRQSGFRLERTGNTRPPKHDGWGYPKIHELELVVG